MRALTVVALATSFATSTHAAEIAGSSFGYGNWNGGAYTDDETGLFSHCAIFAEYLSGDTLLFSVNRDATVGVGVLGDLGLVEGQQFPVALYVDRMRPFYGTATALDADFASLWLADFDAAMTALKKGLVLRVEALGEMREYSLTGTFRALERAKQCALRHFNHVSQPEPAAPPAISAVDRTVLFQMSTSIISELGVGDARYLDGEELDQDGFSRDVVVWRSEKHGLVGTNVIVPAGEGASLRDTDGEDTAYLTSGCEGDFATTARSLDLGDGDEARELRMLCDDGTETAESFLTKFRFGDYVAYTVLHFVGDPSAGEAQSRSEQSERATLRAASFLAD